MSIRFTSFGIGRSEAQGALSDAGWKVYCFPNAGGSAALYRALAAESRHALSVRAALLPGRDGRFGERPYETWPELVRAATAAIHADAPERYALMGHSMGALVAFEVARAIRRDALNPPSLLVVSARQGPACTSCIPPVSHLPDEDLARAMAASAGGVPAELLADRDSLALFMPILRSDMRLLEAYAYVAEDPLDVPILSLAGDDDPLTALAGVEAWREQTSSRFLLQRFSGDHWFIRMHVPAIARAMLRQLAPEAECVAIEPDTPSAQGNKEAECRFS